jgi:hypothetical protein
MKEMGKDVKVLYDEVGRWVDDPRRLFPPYSVEYLHAVLSRVASSNRVGPLVLGVGMITCWNYTDLPKQPFPRLKKYFHHLVHPDLFAKRLGCIHVRLWQRDVELFLERAQVERLDESVERQDWVTEFADLKSLVKVVVADPTWVAHFSRLLRRADFGDEAVAQSSSCRVLDRRFHRQCLKCKLSMGSQGKGQTQGQNSSSGRTWVFVELFH